MEIPPNGHRMDVEAVENKMTDPTPLEVMPNAEPAPAHPFGPPPEQITPIPPKLNDRTGEKVGHLTIIRFHQYRPELPIHYRIIWMAQCICGRFLTIDNKQIQLASPTRCCPECRISGAIKKSPPQRNSRQVVTHNHPNRLRKERTLYNVFQAWLDSKGSIAPSTRAHYQDCLENFELFVANKRLCLETWEAYWQELISRNYSPARLRKLVEIPKWAFKWAKVMGYISGDWWMIKPLRLPPIVKRKKAIFTYEEYERMKLACRGATAHLQYQLIVTCYATGMSPVDVCTLRWSGVDWQEQKVHFVRGKMVSRGGRECSIPFDTDSDFHRLLLHQQEMREEEKPVWTETDYVFPQLARYYVRGIDYAVDTARPGGHNDLWQMIKGVLKRAGISGNKSLKSFRNTFCSDMLASGVDVITVCQMSGHANPKTLLEYCTPDVKQLHEATQRRMEYARRKSAPLQLPQVTT